MRIETCLLLVPLLGACSRGEAAPPVPLHAKDGTLVLLHGAPPAEPEPLPGGGVVRARLDPDDPRLDDATELRCDVYRIAGRAGELLKARMRSDEVDPLLVAWFEAPGAPARYLAHDDDGGVDGEAALAVELPADGVVRLVASTARAAFGAYALELDLAPPLALPASTAPLVRAALLVGDGDYFGDEVDLPAVAEDVRLVEAALRANGWHDEELLVIRDGRVTYRNVVRAIREFLGRVVEGGVVLFYYSGHGMRLDANILLTGELDPEADGVDDALVFADGEILVDDELHALLRGLAARTVLAIVDACNSGTVARGPELVPKEIEREPNRFALKLRAELHDPAHAAELAALVRARPRAPVLLASAREDEIAWAIPQGTAEHPAVSIFTLALSRALESAPPDAPLAELHARVVREVDALCRGRRERQSPQLLGAHEGLTVAVLRGEP